MRIVGGRLGGRRLPAEPPGGVRPTADRVREAVASALEARGAVRGARVLDLFAGTGALSFEALSRGASFAILAEKDPKARRSLAQNAEALGLMDQAKIVALDLLAEPAKVAHALAEEGPFDLIFADPPYIHVHRAASLLSELVDAGLLAEGGLAVLEGPTDAPPHALRRLAPVRVYRYGDTLVSLLEETRNP